MAKVFSSKLFFLILFLISFNEAFAGFPTGYQPTLDITHSDKVFKMKDNSVRVSMKRPSFAMQPFYMTFVFTKDNIKKLHFKTNMEMPMGNFSRDLPITSDNIYNVNLTLPRCGSGRTLWYGAIELIYENGMADKQYFFYNLK